MLEKHVEHALGTVERPMSDRDFEEKFRSLTDGILSAAQSDKAIELCWRIPELPDTGERARATVAQPLPH